MRTDAEINEEIKKIRALAKKTENGRPRYNSETRQQFEAQAQALESRWSELRAEREHYVDESSDEYRDGDNETYHEVCKAIRWMNGREKESPSDQEG